MTKIQFKAVADKCQRLAELPEHCVVNSGSNGSVLRMADFTAAERLAIVVILDEIDRRAMCSLSHLDVARRAGVGRFTVRQAVGKAEAAGLVTVARRQSEGDTNLIRRA